jgi:phosphogluconate dehydratase
MHSVVEVVTDRIVKRSLPTRQAYLRRIKSAADEGPSRSRLSCSNLAHGIAACGATEKEQLANGVTSNVGIVTAYNDMLSAH